LGAWNAYGRAKLFQILSKDLGVFLIRTICEILSRGISDENEIIEDLLF
jgi:hypothetical protein